MPDTNESRAAESLPRYGAIIPAQAVPNERIARVVLDQDAVRLERDVVRLERERDALREENEKLQGDMAFAEAARREGTKEMERLREGLAEFKKAEHGWATALEHQEIELAEALDQLAEAREALRKIRDEAYSVAGARIARAALGETA